MDINLEKIPLQIINEGLAKVYVPDLSKYRRPNGTYEPAWAPVFYNPVMKLNRDLSILVLQTYARSLGKPVMIADILAGTGVRGIRFCLEVNSIDKVYINDKNPLAYNLILKNIKLNGLEETAIAENLDANLMLRIHEFSEEYFDYIDVDPFGSPIEFIDSALSTIKIGGMLGVTATDTATLEGTYPSACLRKYFAKSIKADFSKESALRILISAIAFRAAALEYGIKVKLGYYDQYYVRVYIVLVKGAKKALSSLKNIGYVLFNPKTGEYKFVKSISEFEEYTTRDLNKKYVIGGPMWLGSLGEIDFVKKTLNEALKRAYLKYSKLIEVLSTIVKELNLPPLYYRVDMIGKRLKKSIPPMDDFLDCLKSYGYASTRTHYDKLGIKTNAPIEVINECFSRLSKG